MRGTYPTVHLRGSQLKPEVSSVRTDPSQELFAPCGFKPEPLQHSKKNKSRISLTWSGGLCMIHLHGFYVGDH